MALLDQVLKLVTREEKKPTAENESRSTREAKIKDKAGLTITIFALLLSINSWYGGKLSSTVLNNTLGANNTWNQYQAKASRGVSYELAAATTDDKALKEKFTAEAERMDSDKVELAAKAREQEALRDEAKKSSPWIGYASTAYQLAIVVLSASILAVSMPMFFGSFVVAGIGILLSAQGVFLIW
jgi:hypothetical protein